MPYLVLTPGNDGEANKVVIPQGHVVVKEDAVPGVPVECPRDEEKDAQPSMHTYHLHRRWKGFKADVMSARLQLVAMLATTDTLLPDVRAGMTSFEKAMVLIRRCFVNHPLQDTYPEVTFNGAERSSKPL